MRVVTGGCERARSAIRRQTLDVRRQTKNESSESVSGNGFNRWIGIWCGDAGLIVRWIDHSAAGANHNSIFFAEHRLVVEEFHCRLDAGNLRQDNYSAVFPVDSALPEC